MVLNFQIDRYTTRLDLAGNYFGHDGIRNLCDMLKENDIITHIVRACFIFVKFKQIYVIELLKEEVSDSINDDTKNVGDGDALFPCFV